MSDLFWLTRAQLKRIEPHFPLSHGVPRVDDLRVVSSIIHVIRNGLHWRDAPQDCGPHKTLYNRFIRWSRMGVFDRIFASLAGERGEPEQLTIDATRLKAHRTAASLLKKERFPAVSDAQRASKPASQPAKPSMRTESTLYRQRHKVECMFGKFKDWRRIATRYDRCAHTFFSAICLVASVTFYFKQ